VEASDLMSDNSTPLRFGIIGCGALGLVHALRLSAFPNVQVRAISDPDADAMQRVAQALAPSAVESFTDYRELLRSAHIDAICINSPNRWHVEQLLASLDRGLHVLCEKPLTMIPAEVEQVVRATEKAGTTVAIAYQSRYRRDSRILRRALQSGEWGRVTSVDVFACEDWITPNRGTWRHDPERCPGGFFADANGHQLDLLFWLTGLQPASVRATIETRGTPVPMVTWGEARLEEGARPSAKVSQEANPSENPTPNTEHPKPTLPFTFTFVGDAKHWREEISIQTEKADFLLRDTRLLWTDGSGGLRPFPDAEYEKPLGELDDTPDAAFIAALRGGPPVVSEPHTVWPVLRFTLAALASARQGDAVNCTEINRT
jgi:predicted dehydrogenase